MKPKVCTYCKQEGHTAFLCYRKRKANGQIKPKKRLNAESKVANNKRGILRNTFFILNPPDKQGGYNCYLQISPLCLKHMPKHYVSAEHCFSKQRFPELKYVQENILPACSPCNASKLSNSPYELAIIFPNVKAMLETEMWLNFMDSLKKAIKDRGIDLWWNDEEKTFKRYDFTQEQHC